ncbi:NADP-dependent 3-hydroxy acid dehydrogenase YdfG [Bradyrhizobium sp. LM3.6]
MSDLFDVSRETILVTGASQGLGRQFARMLAAHGAAVALAARQTDKLKSLEEEIRGKGGRAAAVALDVTDTASIARAVDATEAALGPVTVLINNAGIAIEKLATEQTEADWDAVIGANLKGAYFLATEIARRMIARKQEGNIVNIASVLGTGVLKAVSPYAISKAGIIQATKAMALELAGQKHPHQRAGARLHRHRDEPRLLVDAARRAPDQAHPPAPHRCRVRSRRRDFAAGLEGLAVHDGQRYHRRRWFPAQLSYRISALIMSAAFSPIMIVGALVLPPISVGMIEASTTRRPSTPCTFNAGLTTAIASVPILQVPTG